MSTPLEQLQPPPTGASQQADTANTSHGSVGPVIAVLAVITILGVIAGMIGRLCSGRPIMGHVHYDFEVGSRGNALLASTARWNRLRRGLRRCLRRRHTKRSRRRREHGSSS
ncbi:putative peptidyl-prolyl cis-trans isomerase d, ppid [Hibiscus syriacus]|uniref:Peptidyl-prolyl cis-trans isomerase d, ppid n=1 Tax=Hibiscus syriacus TaxID=106335 RepID=A0A6A2ZGP5_HIBSY|nr:putative peptidyl-prolyl cis-trans isomerase d, ppid [Hibiscus syriacus]